MTERPVQEFGIPALEPDHQRAVAGVELLHLWQQVIGHHRCQRHRNDHAGENRDNVGDAERRKQTALDTRQHEQRHEYQDDDHSRIDDGGTHFQRRGGNDFRHRTRRISGPVQLQAS